MHKNGCIYVSWTLLQVTLLIDLYCHRASGRTQIGLVKANSSVLCFCIPTAEVFRLWKKAASSPVQLVLTGSLYNCSWLCKDSKCVNFFTSWIGSKPHNYFICTASVTFCKVNTNRLCYTKPDIHCRDKAMFPEINIFQTLQVAGKCLAGEWCTVFIGPSLC